MKLTLKIRFEFDAFEYAPRTQWAWAHSHSAKTKQEIKRRKSTIFPMPMSMRIFFFLFSSFFWILINCTQIEYVIVVLLGPKFLLSADACFHGIGLWFLINRKRCMNALYTKIVRAINNNKFKKKQNIFISFFNTMHFVINHCQANRNRYFYYDKK